MASHLDSFSNWNRPLRIQRRGDFFSDDGFQDYRSHFESAAQDLLREFDLTRKEDTFKTYRRFRDHQLTGTDRAAKIAEETDKYKIVMDVEGFSERDLEVKISGPDEIVVEGKQEFTNGGGAFSQRSFSRKFTLPGLAILEAATSVLSSDNILTVNIPKKVQGSSDQSTTTAKQQTTSQLDSQIQDSIQKTRDTVSSFLSDSAQKTSKPSFGDGAPADFFDLEIVPRKSFFDDSYFENVRQNFKQSIDDLVENRRRRVTSIDDDAGVFKKVRETKVENAQAVSVTEDSKEHKIVLDVSGFSETDLKLRAVSDCELIVEGKVEKKTACTNCHHSFKRRFVLPSSVDIRKATSALSSEGILTIIVPKKLEAIDYAIPVRSEKTISHSTNEAAANISNVIKKEQEKEEQRKGDQQLSGRTTTTTTKTTRESQNLADNQKRIGEETNKVLEAADKRELVVPINLEEQQEQEVVKKKTHVTQLAHEPSDVLKESQRLVAESAKLIKELESEKKTDYTTPTDTKTQTISQQTTHITQHTDVAAHKVPSSESTSHSVEKEHKTAIDVSKTKPAGRIIPITIKGSVYDESVFDDARKSIEKNVQEAFSKYRKTSDVEKRSEVENVQKTVKQDSSSLVKREQTTSSIQEDDCNYKIIVDVYGYDEKELNVKLSGVNEITIEGFSDKTKDGSAAKHSFRRWFQLPDSVDLERTTTALSEEGILTITVPKKNKLVLKSVQPVTSKTSKERNESKETKTTMVIDSSGIVQEEKSQRTASSTRDTHGLSGTSTQTDISTRDTSIASDASKDATQSILSTSTSSSSADTQSKSPVEQTAGKLIQIQSVDSSDASTMSTTASHLEDKTSGTVARRGTLFNVPIVARGHFFDDNIFQDSRSMFESILRNKMNRFSKSSSFVDDIGFLKSLRENSITGGNQMTNLSEDDHYNKIVLDVQGFNENNLKVKVMSENEILIEGEVEEKTGNSFSKKTFRKYFLLPGAVDLHGATSALSSDGVLNIRVPKKA